LETKRNIATLNMFDIILRAPTVGNPNLRGRASKDTPNPWPAWR